MSGVGFCECGCGEPAPVYKWNDYTRGHQKGDFKRFVAGHHTRKSPLEYLENEDGCWIWQRSFDRKGYGKLKVDGKIVAAHRLYFERECGPVPEGLELDHMCHVPACVNPAHLDAVTRSINLRRRRWNPARWKGAQ